MATIDGANYLNLYSTSVGMMNGSSATAVTPLQGVLMPNGERVIGYSVIDDYFLRREGNMVDSGDYTYDMPLTPYPERNDKRGSELDYTPD